MLLKGERFVVVGEFGVGKSYAARELHMEMRKRHFRKPELNPFPIHINLRDCAGLRSPAEVLRRHAEEIGFGGDRGLISAWRSGAAVLILDGFDEVIPARWLGSATSLPDVRWDALSPIRKLVQEAPEGTSVFATGRGHYFNSASEMKRALGLDDAKTLVIDDFDAGRAAEFLRLHRSPSELPEWLPTRPLFLSHLLSAGLLDAVAGLSALDEAHAWRELLRLVSERESRIYSSVPPYTIRGVLQRLATFAKSHDDELVKLSIRDLEQVFFDVSGRPTDEEVIQMLLRLPGLAAAQDGGQEYRLFADRGLASTAYGEDLALYISSPYQGHPLCEAAGWPSAADELAIEACSLALESMGVVANQVAAACENRVSKSIYDSVLADAVRVAQEMGANSTGSYIVENVFIDSLVVGMEPGVLARTLFRDCVISEIDLSLADQAESVPTFEQCLIGQIDGMAQLSPVLADRFRDCSVETYADVSRTTSGILSMDGVDSESRVALSILNKVYAKRGRGRKDSALVRGLDHSMRDFVGPVVERLSASGVLFPIQRKSATVYMPAASMRGAVLAALEAPALFNLDDFLGEFNQKWSDLVFCGSRSLGIAASGCKVRTCVPTGRRARSTRSVSRLLCSAPKGDQHGSRRYCVQRDDGARESRWSGTR